jgi:hypothetical protein
LWKLSPTNTEFQKSFLTFNKFLLTNKNMKSIVINFHSFVDLITNSSSETYITASDKTISAVKDIIKLFLEAANIATPVDELFDVKLVCTDYSDDDKEIEREGESEYRPSRVKVSVKPGVTDFGDLVKVLNALNTAFSSQEYYN